MKFSNPNIKVNPTIKQLLINMKYIVQPAVNITHNYIDCAVFEWTLPTLSFENWSVTLAEWSLHFPSLDMDSLWYKPVVGWFSSLCMLLPLMRAAKPEILLCTVDEGLAMLPVFGSMVLSVPAAGVTLSNSLIFPVDFCFLMATASVAISLLSLFALAWLLAAEGLFSLSSSLTSFACAGLELDDCFFGLHVYNNIQIHNIMVIQLCMQLLQQESTCSELCHLLYY